jgi:transcriptional regulator with XRE-family HTH domain
VLLKNEIDDLNIPITTLASKCNVTRQTISNWLENPDAISAKNARALADALRITDRDKLMSIFLAPNVEESSTT